MAKEQAKPVTFDGMTPEEFLEKTKLKRGRPSKELQEKLDAARAAVEVKKAARLAKQENPAEIIAAVEQNMQLLRLFSRRLAQGKSTAIIASGAAGIGKTYNVTDVLVKMQEEGKIKFHKISGKATPIQFYMELYRYRSSDSVVLMDDTDAVLQDEDSLNILKAALDTNEPRKVSWLSDAAVLKNEGIEQEFIFEGRIAFITNVDLAAETTRNNRLTPHLKALMSRSHYLDLGLHNKQSQAHWTAHVIRATDMLVKHPQLKLSAKRQEEVVTYILGNYPDMKDISLRAALKMGEYMEAASELDEMKPLPNGRKYDWRDVAKSMGYGI